MIWHAPVRVLKWRCQVLLAPVPQLDRGPVYETVSWAFEPPRAHKKAPPPVVLFFFTVARVLGFRVWFGGRLDEAVAQARDEL